MAQRTSPNTRHPPPAAGNAKAEADKAKADAKAAESRATVVADCAKPYLSALGTLLEGDDVRAQAEKIREQLKGITTECQATLGAAEAPFAERPRLRSVSRARVLGAAMTRWLSRA